MHKGIRSQNCIPSASDPWDRSSRLGIDDIGVYVVNQAFASVPWRDTHPSALALQPTADPVTGRAEKLAPLARDRIVYQIRETDDRGDPEDAAIVLEDRRATVLTPREKPS